MAVSDEDLEMFLWDCVCVVFWSLCDVMVCWGGTEAPITGWLGLGPYVAVVSVVFDVFGLADVE
jgi:hypothetical protein